MTNLQSTDISEIDVHELLKASRQIAVIWCIEDVQSLRPDLNAEAAWKVLQECKHSHDCTIGLNWEFIECVAEDLFPEPEEIQETREGSNA